MPRIEVYSTDTCGFCSRVRRLLDRKGVSYTEIRIDLEQDRHAELLARCGRDSVPQVFVDDRHLGGYEDLVELDFEDELDPMLGIGGENSNTRQTEGNHDG